MIFILTTFNTLVSLFPVARVTTEVTRGGKLPEFMAHHIFGYENRNKGFAIMHCDGLADHVGDNHRRAAPGFDNLLAIALLCFFDLLQQRVMDVWAFFE